ncbi:hypothetical protein SG34_007300 [Thalassomonas viridans]|uniref:Peptidase MA-like domain-containing protein n=1 Tax=Thalassomonas viridans TaxID=137584 RepID=A0AAF0CAB9_9GAMM|nr:hypothetical protein [Thalassomonas viridans]WDE06703.1 hypothetical protein SG34_007300 [Thalassomonas viridans]
MNSFVKSFISISLAVTAGLCFMTNVSYAHGWEKTHFTGSEAAAGAGYCWQDPRFRAIKLKAGKGAFTIYHYVGDKELAEEIAASALTLDKELQDFFELERQSPFRLYVATDRQHWERLSGTNLDWEKAWYVVGSMLTANDQVVINPDKWDKRSHEFVVLRELVKHELAHSYAYALRGQFDSEQCRLTSDDELEQEQEKSMSPYWIEEGLATVVAGQLSTWEDRVVKSLKENSEFAHAMDPKRPNYSRAGAATLFLLETYGKETYFQALKLVTDGCRDDQPKCNAKFLGAFSQDSKQLEAQWLAYIDKKWPEYKEEQPDKQAD